MRAEEECGPTQVDTLIVFDKDTSNRIMRFCDLIGRVKHYGPMSDELPF